MKWIMVCEKTKRILIPVVLIMLSGCGHYLPLYDLPQSSTMGGTMIHKGTQASFHCGNDYLTLGSPSSYYFADFIDEFGDRKMEKMSGLWISIKNKPESRKYFAVYAGLSIHYYSEIIEVYTIGVDIIDHFIEVEVNNLEQSGEMNRCSPY
ncbi:MAG: hypothetical protein JW748_07595 [Anaerolineales bacterium]|nr:hypothetical protein [Anaerolineales bacterium]